jgi:hypothetical protein
MRAVRYPRRKNMALGIKNRRKQFRSPVFYQRSTSPLFAAGARMVAVRKGDKKTDTNEQKRSGLCVYMVLVEVTRRVARGGQQKEQKRGAAAPHCQKENFIEKPRRTASPRLPQRACAASHVQDFDLSRTHSLPQDQQSVAGLFHQELRFSPAHSTRRQLHDLFGARLLTRSKKSAASSSEVGGKVLSKGPPQKTGPLLCMCASQRLMCVEYSFSFLNNQTATKPSVSLFFVSLFRCYLLSFFVFFLSSFFFS